MAGERGGCGVGEIKAEALRAIEEAASRHGVSVGAARQLAVALASGGGTQAQFDIAELGGMGQWSRGGMTMVGDMFNTALKARVDALATDLAELVRDGSLFMAETRWWPGDLGRPAASGAQNDMRYAVFPEARRLAVERDGRVVVHDTGAHRIGGVSQHQQGPDRGLRFTSQLGAVGIAELPVVSGETEPGGEIASGTSEEPSVADADATS